ncbi:MAG: malonyl-CoA decarboxylase [Methylobacteriaceae bacterium]|nr:malonyl-CoA decarboxylase [Methylobacteriaceae bacterium]
MVSSFFNDLVQKLGDRSRYLLGLSRDVVAGGDLAEIGAALLSRRGEASGVALARALLEGYAAAPLAARLAFLTALADRFGADPRRVEEAVAAYRQDPSPDHVLALHQSAEAPRQELFRRLNLAPGGTAALVRMRAELLDHLPSRPDLRPVDSDFVHLFSSWFNRGFLVLRPIDWATPANILERIIRYEAVHAIRDWDDLRARLEPDDRRCFGFFHPQLADEPLIFVEVALTSEIPGAIAPLLAADRRPIRAVDATTAVFYSISNTQKGLGGVSFGHFLIKQVAEDLRRALPNLRTFVTLSPVPGFARWLGEARRTRSDLLPDDVIAGLAALDEPGYASDPARLESLRRPLTTAAANYFLRARDGRGRPLDPVARFHLGNGARLERLNPFGDLSEKGLAQSHGLMVNYCYDLDEIERNHEAYAEKGEVIASSAIRRLARPDRATTRELAAAQ